MCTEIKADLHRNGIKTKPLCIQWNRSTVAVVWLWCEKIQVRISPQAVRFVTTATALGTSSRPLLQCLGGLSLPYDASRGLSAIAESHGGTVKQVSAFGMSNANKWRWWMCMVAAYTWLFREVTSAVTTNTMKKRGALWAMKESQQQQTSGQSNLTQDRI